MSERRCCVFLVGEVCGGIELKEEGIKRRR